MTQTLVVYQPNTFIRLDGLKAETDYVIEVCPFNEIGNGPCERTSATTFIEGIYNIISTVLSTRYPIHENTSVHFHIRKRHVF